MAAAAPELKTLGRYNIERTLGKGAMGVVYEGVDPRLGRRVAIKTILKSHLDEETARDYSMRFVREAQAVARLNHPNIVQVYDFGEESDIAYLVMEFIKGKELKNFFDANERFDLKEAVRIMCELCDALDFAHSAGIIHRDIKPANVMIDVQARTKLTDFGVARVQDSDKTSVERTQAGTMVGTPAYMSPEQITGGNLDKRTDVFSAGIILYQFLTGEKPFTGSGAWTIAKKIIQEEPPLPSSLNNAITPLFDAVVNKALAKNPDQRFQSARDLAVGLRRALEGKPFEDDSDRTVVGGLGMDFGASRPAPIVAKVPAQDSARTSNTNTQGSSQEIELEFWRAIKDGNDPDDFELYVQQFPNGIYAKLAKRKIAKLRGVPLDDESTAKAKEQEKKEAEEAARREAEVKAKLEAEKARLEAEMARKEEEYRKREAEAEAKRQAAEQARIEAEERTRKEAAEELARRDAEAKAKAEADAKARDEAEKKAREDFARREADLKKRVAAAEAAPGGKRQSIKYAAIVGVVVLAIAGVVIFVLPKEDPQAAAKLKAVQEQLEQAKKKADELEQAKKKEGEARVALEKARRAEDEARKAGDKNKEKELAEARRAAEAEAKLKADATRTKEQEKLAADARTNSDTRKQATERSAPEKVVADKLAAEKAVTDRLAVERAAAEKAAAEARAAADRLAQEKVALEAERARIERAKLSTAQPSGAGGAGSFHVAQSLEGEGKGKDAVKAYIAAARGGSCESAKRLGDIYDKGLIGVSRDYAESLKWYGFARALGTCEVPAPARR
ncbi:MAG: protein kinase [Betaproteobacteria bacterium]|nr:protein kinase [Betaproteobacteria bacterium]